MPNTGPVQAAPPQREAVSTVSSTGTPRLTQSPHQSLPLPSSCEVLDITVLPQKSSQLLCVGALRVRIHRSTRLAAHLRRQTRCVSPMKLTLSRLSVTIRSWLQGPRAGLPMHSCGLMLSFSAPLCFVPNTLLFLAHRSMRKPTPCCFFCGFSCHSSRYVSLYKLRCLSFPALLLFAGRVM